MSIEHIDVLIVGAGLSGIGAAAHLGKNCPERSFAVLEGRERLGGTWDLFRYPGIRSDSDMYTLGYAFKPWTEEKAIADGDTILSYIASTARDHGIDEHIRYGHRVTRANWSQPDGHWLVDISTGPHSAPQQLSCNFLYICTGYYNYDSGHTPAFEGSERFTGRIVHPQNWTTDVDYAGKRVVVIGSGATAVTLVPTLAATAAHVTMLQRSPTYVVSRPSRDPIAASLGRHLPGGMAYSLTRWKNVLLGMFFFRLSKRRPEKVKKLIIDGVKKSVGPTCDVDKHFTPSYKPWDQRVCLVPDADLFKAIRSGKASVVTEHIDTFTETGVRLKSGQELQADVVVTATGLDLLALGGMELLVDGRPVVMKDSISYKGMMLSGVPNMIYVTGYTNASWTLKADLVGDYACRLLNFMARKGWGQCTPTLNDPGIQPESWIDFTSGYIQRAIDKFPAQGNRRPWRLSQNYVLDLFTLRYGRVDDGTMVFTQPTKVRP
ncbi:MAG: NAD(P)/FAD-dependent oxidoreductase [Pseudomonadota bacterium]